MSIHNRFIRVIKIGVAIVLASHASWSVAVDTVLDTIVAEQQVIPEERLFDAVIEAVNQATVSAQTSGRIQAINYDVDDFVPKGAELLRIRDKEQRSRVRQAEAGLREATARHQEASDEYVRVKGIYEKKLISKAELDKAEAARKAAKARLEQAQAKLTESKEQLQYTVVKAPYSGIVTKRHVEVGETVAMGKPLMTGFSLESLRATAQIPQAFVKAVRTHAMARVELSDGSSVMAASMRVFPYADEQTHAFRVRVNLPEGDYGVYPGMFVKVGFVTGKKTGLLVPASAVVRRSELTAIYVVTNASQGGEPQGERISFRQIRAGRVYNGQVEVLSGLEVGERVVIDPIAAGIALKQQGH